MPDDSEFNRAPTAAPARASLTGVNPPLDKEPIPNTIPAPIAAPKKEKAINPR